MSSPLPETQPYNFDWSTPICEEWSKYAEKLGWTKPCRLRVKANLIDDIR